MEQRRRAGAVARREPAAKLGDDLDTRKVS